jgi:hypothetical protein
MTTRTTRSAVDWDAVADPILATPPWRPRTSRPPQAMAGAATDPHEHDWAGPGFTKPGPEPDVGYHTGYARGKAEAVASMTPIADPLVGGLDGEGAHCARLQRPAQSQLPEGTSASAQAGARFE